MVVMLTLNKLLLSMSKDSALYTALLKSSGKWLICKQKLESMSRRHRYCSVRSGSLIWLRLANKEKEKRRQALLSTTDWKWSKFTRGIKEWLPQDW